MYKAKSNLNQNSFYHEMSIEQFAVLTDLLGRLNVLFLHQLML